MRKSHNRALLAERASTSTRPLGPVSSDLRARPLTVVKPSGPGIRRPKAKMTGAQRNSEGRRSEWNASPYTRDAVMTDRKWSATVSNV